MQTVQAVEHILSASTSTIAFSSVLSTLKTGLIDVIDVSARETWKAMEALVAKGKIRSIGVSNFTRERIEDLLKT